MKCLKWNEYFLGNPENPLKQCIILFSLCLSLSVSVRWLSPGFPSRHCFHRDWSVLPDSEAATAGGSGYGSVCRGSVWVRGLWHDSLLPPLRLSTQGLLPVWSQGLPRQTPLRAPKSRWGPNPFCWFSTGWFVFWHKCQSLNVFFPLRLVPYTLMVFSFPLQALGSPPPSGIIHSTQSSQSRRFKAQPFSTVPKPRPQPHIVPPLRLLFSGRRMSLYAASSKAHHQKRPFYQLYPYPCFHHHHHLHHCQ